MGVNILGELFCKHLKSNDKIKNLNNASAELGLHVEIINILLKTSACKLCFIKVLIQAHQAIKDIHVYINYRYNL